MSDEILIQEILAGNEAAFRRFVETYRDHLFRTIYAIVRHQKDAEDITQETLIQIYTSLPQYRSQGFKTWITRIAVNKAIDFTRKVYRKREVLADKIRDDYSFGSLDSENVIEHTLLNRERRDEIKEQLNKMPENYRDVIYAYYFEEKSYQEIADAEHIPVQNVATRIHRGRNWLKKHWKEGDFL